ncbi:MAG: murein biosynthesis integral membrane protein MurJ, partial [Sulfuricurvum sp.]|nr:murein biosynthesis integral membrane protein MurJ [Sulfuricurvum sp.]
MFKSIFANSSGILFSRVLGFVRDMMTASVLGANLYSDIFFIAFKLPNLFRRIFAEGAFTQSFLPAYTHSRNKSLFSIRIFIRFVSIIGVMTLAVFAFPEAATKIIALGYDDKTLHIAAPYVTINFTYLILIFVVTFLGTYLQYKNRFAVTAYATGLLNMTMIAALYLAQGKDQPTAVYYLSWGVVAGGVLQVLVHLVAVHYAGLTKSIWGGFKYYYAKAHRVKDETKTFNKQFLPAIWGNSTAQVSAFVDTWIATYLGAGAISYLYYANRVFQLPLALFAIATATALFPKIARYLKNSDETKALQNLSTAFWFLAFTLLYSTMGGIILAPEMTSLLFERGAFSASDTVQTSLVLQMYMVGLLIFGLSKLFSLWLYATNQQSYAAKIATYMLVTHLIVSLSLLKILGAAGLALGTSMSGLVGLYMTLKAFGWGRFWGII